jgi:hypothetical protein
MKLSFAVLLLLPALAVSGEADVVKVDVEARGARLYKFDVTVAHKDEGWDHYVDMWEIVAPDGTVLGKRAIFNPHEGVSSFSSALVGVKIPPNINEVIVRAHDLVHEYKGKAMTVAVPK